MKTTGLGENEDSSRLNLWKSMWQDLQPLIESIMQLTTEEDTLKRARSILERFQHHLASTAEDDGDQQKQDSHDRNTEGSVEDDISHDDSAEADQLESGPPKAKSNKKNKKKKSHT